MPNWKVMVSPLLLFAIANSTPDIQLKDGEPLDTVRNGVRVRFDSKQNVTVTSKHRKVVFAAKLPATISTSPDGRMIVHNYGNGSGQVYDLAIYDLMHQRKINLTPFKNGVVRFAKRQHNCRIMPDKISYLSGHWIRSDILQIRTEDWSRTSDCSGLNRSWTFQITK
jgi:hypothetical protein